MTNELVKEEVSAGLLTTMQQMGHEQVAFCNDPETGLKAIIAVHSTVLGPALGGCRMWHYANDVEALNDVLRLSRGMTYKNAIAGLDLGGGKAVIIGNNQTEKTKAKMERFGRFVNQMGGTYITAEDVGIGTEDIETIFTQTPHVTGKPESMGGGGNPSPFTSYGVYLGLKACLKEVFGSDSAKGKRIVIQGTGAVGSGLARRLAEEGAILIFADYYPEKAAALAAELGATTVGIDDVYSLDVDVYAPCALGATLNTTTINQLHAPIVAGAANNQLADEKLHGQMLMEKGILYAPDFLINSGGVINVFQEYIGYDKNKSLQKVENIYSQMQEVIKLARAERITTHQAAVSMAEARLLQGRKK